MSAQRRRQSAGSGDLRSHQQRTVESLAKDVLSRQAGDKIKTMAEYQHDVGVGSGTVQNALSFLESVDAVTLSRHGHQGTRIVDLDRSSLWRFTGRGPVQIVSVLPGPIDAFGLQNGLEQEFAKVGIPVVTQYQRGASHRVKRVRSGRADVAVLSKGAVSRMSARRLAGTATIELAPGTYYARGSLVCLERSGPKPSALRVGVDRNSADHEMLTEVEFPPGAGSWEYVDCPYSGLPAALLSGKVDVGIWHRTLLPARVVDLGLRERALAAPDAAEILDDISSAVLLLRSQDAALARLLEGLDMGAIARQQAALLKMDPASEGIHDAVWSRP